MKALVYRGPGSKSWEDVAKPEIGPTRTRSCAWTRSLSATVKEWRIPRDFTIAAGEVTPT
jgi:hypothetical protein